MLKIKRYKHLFFDLDHTLWDHDRNSDEALEEIFVTQNLVNLGINNLQSFQKEFSKVNYHLWEQYERGLIKQDELRQVRFQMIFEKFSIKNDKLCDVLSEKYIDISPDKGALIPKSMETLMYLSKKYKMSIITNGFPDIQIRKMKASKIDHFFDYLITANCSGYPKPNRQIFEFALEKVNLKANECLMVGDNFDTDINGALNAGLDAIFFSQKINKLDANFPNQISCLSELIEIL